MRRLGPAAVVALCALLLLLTGPAAGQEVEEPAAEEPTAGVPATGLPPVVNPFAEVLLDDGAPRPVIVGSGVDALLSRPDLRGANAPTLLERYGAQGHTLDEQRVGGTHSDRALNAIAGGLFAVAAWIGLAVTAIVQWAFTVELLSFLGDTVDAVVGVLRTTVYAPFVTVAIVLAGGWAAWHGLARRRGTRAAEGLLWVVGALVAGAVFFASPGALIDATNTVSTELSRATLAAVSVADPGRGPDDGVTTRPTFDGHRADQQLRRAADRFWRVFVHQPWLVLQFGDPDRGAVYAERLLEAKTIQPEEAAARSDDAEALEALVAEKQDAYLAVQDDILADPVAAEWFRGGRSVERVGVATLALVGVLLGGLLMAVIAVALLLAQVGLLLLVLLAPLALLAGIHPGAGRLLALRWAGLAVGLLLKRVALGVLLAVVLVVNGVLLDAAYALGWLVVMGLQSLVVAAAVVYRKALARLLAPTTVPVMHTTRVTAGSRDDRQPAQTAPGSLSGMVRLAPFTIRQRSVSRQPRHLARAPHPPNGDGQPAPAPSNGDPRGPLRLQRRVRRTPADPEQPASSGEDEDADGRSDDGGGASPDGNGSRP